MPGTKMWRFHFTTLDMTHLEDIVLNVLLLPIHLTKALPCSLLPWGQSSVLPCNQLCTWEAPGRQVRWKEREPVMRQIWFAHLALTLHNKIGNTKYSLLIICQTLFLTTYLFTHFYFIGEDAGI